MEIIPIPAKKKTPNITKVGIMKKSVLFLLSAAMVFSFVGCGNASFTKFNGIPFGKTHKEVMPQIEKILSEQGYEGKARKSTNHLTGLTRYSEQFDNVQLDDYTAENLSLLFIDNDENKGTVDDAKFYEAYYTFVFPDHYQASDALEYFRDKYIKIYGKPSYENIDSPVIHKVRWDNSDNTAMFVIKLNEVVGTDGTKTGDYCVTLTLQDSKLFNEYSKDILI